VTAVVGTDLDVDAMREVLAQLDLAAPSDRVSLRRLTAGASRAMYRVDVEHGGGLAQYVLRLVGDELTGSHGIRVESELLRVGRAAGVPAPQVFGSTEDSNPLGVPYLLMGYVAGETIPKRILTEPRLAAARSALPAQLGAALGRLHTVPTGRVTVDVGGPRDEVAEWRDYLDSYGQPHPAFELAMRWLDAHRPDPVPDVLLHGDFRIGNVIVDEHGLAAVLDWELAHIGDPREDLGWLTSPSWRFGRPLPVGGVGGYDQLLDAYAQVSGVRFTAQELRWFEVLGTLRWGVLCVRQTMRHIRGATRSVELAALGRRVCEIEWDVLELIA
jgi:aminoglycoside phosphotransferase (APT) family kinase protein